MGAGAQGNETARVVHTLDQGESAMALRRPKGSTLVIASALGLALGAVGLTGCSTTQPAPAGLPAGTPAHLPQPSSGPAAATASNDPTDPGYTTTPADPAAGAGPPSAAAPIPSGPTLGQRASSALNGMLIGAIIGGQAGPFGAAAGAAILLVYSAVTGDVPLSGGGGYGGGYGGGGYGSYPGGYGYPSGQERDRERALEEQIESEERRQASLESEIEEELKRQEELLRSVEGRSAVRSAAIEPGPAPTAGDLRDQSDPRVAPAAPPERDLPASVYEEQTVRIAAATWDNDAPLTVKRRTLDADGDGKPEEVVFIDSGSGALLRKENDLDYDGTIDAWSLYRAGQIAAREVDSDRNGKVDTFETYIAGRMATREVDRNGDGVRDAFFRYEGDSLVEERHDTDNDGQVDLSIAYEQRRRVRSEEDTNKDGRIDTWTTFSPGEGESDVISRIEKDRQGSGKPDTFETYVQQDGKALISLREEDANGDGTIDVRSRYENGKLKNREITDASAVPL